MFGNQKPETRNQNDDEFWFLVSGFWFDLR